jgi:hypothetical protein
MARDRHEAHQLNDRSAAAQARRAGFACHQGRAVRRVWVLRSSTDPPAFMTGGPKQQGDAEHNMGTTEFRRFADAEVPVMQSRPIPIILCRMNTVNLESAVIY